MVMLMKKYNICLVQCYKGIKDKTPIEIQTPEEVTLAELKDEFDVLRKELDEKTPLKAVMDHMVKTHPGWTWSYPKVDAELHLSPVIPETNAK